MNASTSCPVHIVELSVGELKLVVSRRFEPETLFNVEWRGGSDHSLRARVLRLERKKSSEFHLDCALEGNFDGVDRKEMLGL